jgi:hypothetical protein
VNGDDRLPALLATRCHVHGTARMLDMNSVPYCHECRVDEAKEIRRRPVPHMIKPTDEDTCAS